MEWLSQRFLPCFFNPDLVVVFGLKAFCPVYTEQNSPDYILPFYLKGTYYSLNHKRYVCYVIAHQR